jgi:putative transposase
MLKGFKYRLYPNAAQRELIEKTFGVCRFVRNLALETKIRAYRDAGIKLTGYDLQKQFTELRKEFPWMQEVNRCAVDAAILDMDVAYKRFFSGYGFPKFKNKRGRQSFTSKSDGKVDFHNGTISVIKIAKIKAAISIRFEGEIRRTTISRTATGKYYATILVKTTAPNVTPPNKNKAVGIDLGLSAFAILSTGQKIENPRYLREQSERLCVLQRRAAKKKIGSSNHKKALLSIAILHERIGNQRNDFLHKTSAKLVRDNQTDTICVEALAVGNMVQNHALARSISDASWGEFIRQLEYKGQWYGKNIVKIDRFYPSSKTCSACGHKVEELPLSAREWTCKCGATHDRDINAAINIRNSGMGNPVASVERPALMGRNEAEINNSLNVNPADKPNLNF